MTGVFVVSELLLPVLWGMPQRETCYVVASELSLLRSQMTSPLMLSFAFSQPQQRQPGTSFVKTSLCTLSRYSMLRHMVSFVYLLPRNIVTALLITYRKLISPLYGDVCRYYPTCSHYGLQAIQQRGVIVGSALTVRRLGRCHPWARGGIDDVPPARHEVFRVTHSGFVVLNQERSKA